MTYSEKLKDPRWQKKRLEILERDNWACRACTDTKETLHVHHLAYQYQTDPWDYDNELLLTLCETCHECETAGRPGAESDLISMLRHAGFLVNSLGALASAFQRVAMLKDEYRTAEVIAYAIETPEIMRVLEKTYLANYKSDFDKYKEELNGKRQNVIETDINEREGK